MIGYQRFIRMAILSALTVSFGWQPSLAGGNGKCAAHAKGDNICARVERLTKRVDFQLQQGTITKDQAAKLRADISDIKKQADGARTSNKGALNPTQIADFENQLNQQLSIIDSFGAAGKRKVKAGNVVGADWTPGEDGAQNAGKLKQKMKVDQRRLDRQYQQAQMQIKEQQQQQYEKEMLNELGQQRPAILQNKKDIKNIRDSSGAN
jgi:hypothetical protein